MEIKGSNTCHSCGRNIEWLGYIWEGGMEIVPYGTRKEAELIATGKIMTSNGKKVTYDVIVTCPHCHTKNKFNY